MTTEQRFETNPQAESPPSRCPKCGSENLCRQDRPDGQIEYLCLDLDCDFSQVLPNPRANCPSQAASFPDRVARMSDSLLREVRVKLEQSAQSLSGRAGRLAGRQLAIVNAELQRRRDSSRPIQDAAPEPSHASVSAKVPPQFSTPQAAARRIQGIRDYYRRRKTATGNLDPAAYPSAPFPWFDTLLKTLRDEASRHEQAAHNYARVPDLFLLHIEHNARAFEINRIIDMLSNYLPFLYGPRYGEA